MTTEAADAKRDAASAVSDVLSAIDGIDGVCIFGSVARGDASAASDIDVLVLSDDARLTSRALRECLPEAVANELVMISVHTEPALRRYLRRWSRFAAHLRREGWVTHDPHGRLAHVFGVHVPVSTRGELAAQRRHLQDYAHPERFGGRCLFAFARLFRIGRAAVYARLHDHGVLEFDGPTAFRRLADVVPEVAAEIAVVARLSPFNETVRRQQAAPSYPFDPDGADASVRFTEARDAVARLVGDGAPWP